MLLAATLKLFLHNHSTSSSTERAMDEDDAGSRLQGVHTHEVINSPTTVILHE